jgi:hypothetical protein
MTLTPAYGRDYKSKAEVLADFDGDKDFVVADIMSGGGYTNKADLIKQGITEVNIRYKRLTQVLVHKIK